MPVILYHMNLELIFLYNYYYVLNYSICTWSDQGRNVIGHYATQFKLNLLNCT